MNIEEAYKNITQKRDESMEFNEQDKKKIPTIITGIYQRALDMYDKANESKNNEKILFSENNLIGLAQYTTETIDILQCQCRILLNV